MLRRTNCASASLARGVTNVHHGTRRIRSRQPRSALLHGSFSTALNQGEVISVQPAPPVSVPANAYDGLSTSSEALPAAQLLSRRALPPFETLRAFDAIARLGGVRKAAQYLCRDHAVISRHLRAIEDWTGSKLIQRSAAGSVLTEDGVRYHRDIASALDIIARATVDLIKRNDHQAE